MWHDLSWGCNGDPHWGGGCCMQARGSLQAGLGVLPRRIQEACHLPGWQPHLRASGVSAEPPGSGHCSASCLLPARGGLNANASPPYAQAESAALCLLSPRPQDPVAITGHTLTPDSDGHLGTNGGIFLLWPPAALPTTDHLPHNVWQKITGHTHRPPQPRPLAPSHPVPRES